MTAFDASIDLTIHTVPPGTQPSVAVERVRDAVADLPGARWVSVEWCGDAPASLPWIAVYEPGNAVPMTGGAFAAVAMRIEQTVRRVLLGEDRQQVLPSVP